ncbi:cytochrome b [Herbaspirillum rubrisubalbicans]|uniref:Cytochrome b n=1 Tax=Herbaspirillum rubrisubalbicans TaxID=80842 RepID=A0AAD0U834_9BURK|nr:cytochrome b [Herbaspirillum rubrisubalbicans]ALU89407.1 cytochrome b561 protein [Herbaspirillum rubrisubalbicans M1]AYR24468.1 cytochrome b [Herbaspirillum rubrisubalbicans]
MNNIDNPLPQPTRYHPYSVILHWVMFLLFVVALATIEYREDIPKGDPLRDLLRTVHMHAGQLVLILVILRLIARKMLGVPPELPMPKLQRLGAHAVHLLLYVVMIGLPLTGILFTQAGGRDVVFFGMTLPVILAKDMALRGPIKEVHELMGNAVYFLVGLHVLGALWHQLFDRMPILQRMSLRSSGKP